MLEDYKRLWPGLINTGPPTTRINGQRDLFRNLIKSGGLDALLRSTVEFNSRKVAHMFGYAPLFFHVVFYDELPKESSTVMSAKVQSMGTFQPYGSLNVLGINRLAESSPTDLDITTKHETLHGYHYRYNESFRNVSIKTSEQEHQIISMDSKSKVPIEELKKYFFGSLATLTLSESPALTMDRVYTNEGYPQAVQFSLNSQNIRDQVESAFRATSPNPTLLNLEHTAEEALDLVEKHAENIYHMMGKIGLRMFFSKDIKPIVKVTKKPLPLSCRTTSLTFPRSTFGEPDVFVEAIYTPKTKEETIGTVKKFLRGGFLETLKELEMWNSYLSYSVLNELGLVK